MTPFPMMRSLLALAALTPALLTAQSTPPPALDGSWKKIQLTDDFWGEGVAVGDVNKDGHADILYGPYWFQGPDFTKRHIIYPDTKRSQAKLADGTTKEVPGFKGTKGTENEYSDNFQSFVHDVNGDGWLDNVVVSFPGKETFWFENPQGKEGEWKKHTVWSPTDNESPMLIDINGDRRPDLLCMSNGHLGFASYDPANPTAEWKWNAITPRVGGWQKYTHGIGYGDVNGDGKIDVLEPGGWWEQPATLELGVPWKHHPVKFATKGGAQMYVYDVNGDGKNDVIGSLAAHDYGLAWFEQTADGWKQHMIVGSPTEAGSSGVIFSQPHAIELADMNGDGLPDIITGKRVWAHGPKGDAEPNAPGVIYWFELQREGSKVSWKPHLIDDKAGVGTQFTVTDVNGDKKPDVVVGNKNGAHVFLRQ